MKPQLVDTFKAKQYFADKMHFTVGPVELKRWLDEREDIAIIDVRRAEDYAEGHIPGATSLPKDKWEMQNGLRKDKVNVIYCYSIVCHLAPEAAMILADKGYPVMELEGGFQSWQEHKMPVEASTHAAAGARVRHGRKH